MEKSLILASGSPRRKELLTQLGYHFSIVQTDVEEKQNSAEMPDEYVKRLSRDKALYSRNQSPSSFSLGCDTIVVFDGKVLEKPCNLSDSKQMLMTLSNQSHQVITAMTLAGDTLVETIAVTTQVWFKSLSEKEIEQYWLTGEPQDKAGSYAIQGVGGRFVTRIEGSYHAVVGLPLYETDQLLKKYL
jgi:septum formation protein